MTRNIGLVSKVQTPLPPSGYWPDLLNEVYTPDTVECNLGFRIQDSIGRVFHLVKTNEDVVHGDLLTHLVTHLDVSAGNVVATSVGESMIQIDASVSANAWKDGLLCVVDGGGEGYLYPILEHTAGDGSGDYAEVYIEGEVQDALDSNSVLVVQANPFKGVTQSNAADPVVECPIGVAMAAADFSEDEYYIWAQTWGPCLVRAGSTAIDVGDSLGIAEDDDGRVQTIVGAETQAVLGNSFHDAADGLWANVNLMCFP